MIDRILFRLAFWLVHRRYDVVTIVASRNAGDLTVSSRISGGYSSIATRVGHDEAIRSELERTEVANSNAIYVAAVECGL